MHVTVGYTMTGDRLTDMHVDSDSADDDDRSDDQSDADEFHVIDN